MADDKIAEGVVMTPLYTDPRASLGTLRRRIEATDLHRQQRQAPLSVNEITAAAEVQWRRGWQSGIHDACRTLRQNHPEIAEQLAEAFGVNIEDGNLSL